MRYSNELSDLVAKHLFGQAKPSVIAEFNKLVVKMRKDESTIGSAIDKLEELNKLEVAAHPADGGW